ncbi:MAG TPA: ferredoxin--NADP reductase [Acidimicrobiales bacterium]|nr:ferredoxin--NADP reductase [Acidimicrobiales bacterium]
MTVVLPERSAVADHADHADVRREHGYHALGVKQIVQETADTRSFVLDVPEDLRDMFRYRAGQFCTFRTHVGEEELLRCYSMSSAPETDGDLTVTVKRVPGGRVSNWFHDHVAEGDVLEVTKPAGVFCVRDGDRPVVAFAGGSGVTPVMSIAKSVLASTRRPVRLLYANRDRDSVIFHDQLLRLEAGHADRIDVRHHLDGDAGYLDAAAIAAFVGDDRAADFYICGPTPFMDLVEHALLDLGVDPGRILLERFVNAGQPAPAAAPTASTASTASTTVAAAAAARAGGTGAEVPEAVLVILKGKRHAIPYRPGDTVLETARRGALQAPYSCEAGNCATCMALVREGSATMRVNNALTPDEVAEGWVLTCQALPQGPSVTVEYESF